MPGVGGGAGSEKAAITNEHQELLGVADMFIILIMVMTLQLYTCQSSSTVHFKYV